MKVVDVHTATPLQLDWAAHQILTDHDHQVTFVVNRGRPEIWHTSYVTPFNGRGEPYALENGVTPVNLFGTPAGTFTLDWCEVSYTSGYSVMGPIARREGIVVAPQNRQGTYWSARRQYTKQVRFSDGHSSNSYCTCFGDTPLIAQVRCFVLGELGNTFHVPEGL